MNCVLKKVIQVVGFVVLGAFGGVVLAAEPGVCEVPETGASMSERTYNVISKAIEDMDEENFDEAEKQLLDITDKVKDYERAIVYQTLGFIQLQQDRMNAALGSFEEALGTGALPRQANEDLLLNSGQIYLANKNLDRAIATLEEFIGLTCNPVKPEVLLSIASAYTEKEDYRMALGYVEQAISGAEVPEESWLQLKLALHYQMDEFLESARALISLIVLVPGKDEYWNQLSGILLQIEEEEDALAVLAIAEQQGFISTEKELKNLANLYLMLEIPYKAAVLLHEGIESNVIEASAANYEYLSEAWISAYEWRKAQAALEQAAQSAETGNLWVKLAQVRIENEDWTGARSALQSAIETGGMDNPGLAQYLLGIAAYNSNDLDAAIRALQAAVRFDAYRNEAQQWLSHLEDERVRVSANRATVEISGETRIVD